MNAAKETNDLIERLGEDAAWEQFVTEAMVEAVNKEMAKEAQRRAR